MCVEASIYLTHSQFLLVAESHSATCILTPHCLQTTHPVWGFCLLKSKSCCFAEISLEEP